MGRENLKATRQFQRIAALPYNPYFEEALKQIRQKYEIPTAGKKADHFLQYLAQHLKYNELGYPLVTPGDRDPFHETMRTIAEVLESKEARTIYPIEVLVGLEALVLLRRYRLPKYVFRNVHQYLLTGHKTLLAPSSLAPRVEFELISVVKKGLPEWKVTITGLGPWATKRQWAQIWDSKVRKKVEEIRMVVEKVDGMGELGRKRATVESYREQMQRWAEWHQLSVIQAMSAVKALDKWEKNHPEQIDPDNPIDPSTVTRAVKDFQEITRPVPLKE
jgi:hypothetical protein